MAYDSRTDRFEPSFEDRASRGRRNQRRTATEPKRQSTRSAQRSAYRSYGEDDR